MPEIVFPLSSSPGVEPEENGGRLINAYVEKLGEGARGKRITRRAPGMRPLVTANNTHLRGLIEVSGAVFLVFDNRVVLAGSTWAAPSDRGSLPGTDLVTFARNNLGVVLCVSPDSGCFQLFTSATAQPLYQPNLPPVNSVSSLDGYFLWTTFNGQIWASNLNDVTVHPNAFQNCLARPDVLYRGVAFRGEFFAMGASSIEVYRDVGATPFPLQFVTVIPRGIVGTNAVAGWEEGWSNTLLWVADDNTVCQLESYTPKVISTPDVSRAIETAARRTDIYCRVYMVSGHPHFAVTSPGEWTWIFDLSTGQWFERTSYNSAAWNVTASAFVFNAWTVGDDSAVVSKIDPSWYRERDEPLIFHVRSTQAAQFPQPFAFANVQFDFVNGTGLMMDHDELPPELPTNPIEYDPLVRIAWSLDGGYTFWPPAQRPLGRRGKSQTRITVARGGRSREGRGVQFDLQVSDPVHVGLIGGSFDLVP